MTNHEPGDDTRGTVVICPGCGGRNPSDASVCDWCARPFVSPARQLRPSGWQLLSMLFLLALVGAVAALGYLNASRTVATSRPTPAVPAVSTPLPTPAVTPRVTAVTTPAPVATPTAAAATAPATPAPSVRSARVSNTGGAGVQVRAEPGPQARSLGTLKDGTVVRLTGGEQTVAARLWREVETDQGSPKGWVSSDYLEILP